MFEYPYVLIDLNDLKKVIRDCDYKLEEYDVFEEPQLVMDLDSFIHDIASGYLIQREHYFSVDDVLAYLTINDMKHIGKICLKRLERIKNEIYEKRD